MKYIVNTAFLASISLGLCAGSYPTQMLDRPFTLPQNSFESGVKFNNAQVGVLKTDYGITDDFQIGLSWGGMATQEDMKPDMKMNINLGYFLFTSPYASGMLNASMPFYFESAVTQSASFALTTSVPLIRGHLGMLLFYDDLVALDWSKGFHASFNLPVRLNWQATSQLYLKLGTSVANLRTTGEHDHLFNKTPLELSALFAVTPFVDIVGSVSFPKLQQPNDVVMMIGFDIRGGSLEG
ncbi:MAG: hypothetical protein V4534_04300 [Myxococcota bacterium]